MSTDPKSTDQPVPSFPTSLGTSEGTTITLLGQDLAGDLMGNVGFGELAYWLITLRRPTPQQSRLFEAVLLGLADHGFTPTAIAARLTYLSAPDAIQGALAAGILGGGSRFLGVTEDTGRFLAGVLQAAGPLPADEQGWDALARAGGRRSHGGRRRAPLRARPGPPGAQGGRPAHAADHRHRPRGGPVRAAPGPVRGDRPRAPPRSSASALPLNGAGVSGAALADLGLPLELLRGVVLLARCAGLLGHIAEEIRRPIANSIYMTVDRNAEYIPPNGTDDAT